MTIKPCPHCGGHSVLNQRWNYKASKYFIFVRCEVCGSQGKSYPTYESLYDDDYNETADELAIKAWNMRVYPWSEVREAQNEILAEKSAIKLPI